MVVKTISSSVIVAGADENTEIMRHNYLIWSGLIIWNSDFCDYDGMNNYQY